MFSNFRVSYNTDCKVDDEWSQNTYSGHCPSDRPICSYGTCKGKHISFLESIFSMIKSSSLENQRSNCSFILL